MAERSASSLSTFETATGDTALLKNGAPTNAQRYYYLPSSHIRNCSPSQTSSDSARPGGGKMPSLGTSIGLHPSHGLGGFAPLEPLNRTKAAAWRLNKVKGNS